MKPETSAHLIYRDPYQLRLATRANEFNTQTAGQCPGYTQGNLAILPQAYASDFLRFCQLNPKPCPIIGMSEPGDPAIPALGREIDIRTDIAQYCVFENGVQTGETADLKALWRDDFVAFVIGCSFSFEEALIEAGIPLRHVSEGRNVAMWTTNIALGKAGPFGGKMVVNIVAAGSPDKADALVRLMEKSGVDSAVFVGDDLNDEPVFARAQATWLTVRVGRDYPMSRAMYCLDNFDEVVTMLDRMLAALDTPQARD